MLWTELFEELMNTSQTPPPPTRFPLHSIVFGGTLQYPKIVLQGIPTPRNAIK